MALVCDLLGPSQHVGECSFDAIQYILFNADGIKEITRPLFDSISDRDLTELVEHSTPANTFRSRTAIVKGLLAIRDRYKAHFEFLGSVAAEETCAGDPKAIRDFYESLLLSHPKRRLSMEKSIAAAHSLQNKNIYPNNVYKAGNARSHARILLDYIFELFNIRYRTLEPVSVNLPFLTAGIYLSTNVLDGYNRVPTIQIEDGVVIGHILSIVKCNNTWFLYENNKGVYKIPILMLEFIINYMHDSQTDYKLAIATFGENTFVLYKLVCSEEAPDYTLVSEVWSSQKEKFVVPKRGTYIVNDILYLVDAYFLVSSSLYSDITDNNVEAVKQSLNAGIDKNIQDEKGITPLYEASAKGLLEVLRYLLDQGADLTIVNHEGHSPLMAAAYWNQLDAVKILVEKGAEITDGVMNVADPDINETRPDKSFVVRDYLLEQRKRVLEGTAPDPHVPTGTGVDAAAAAAAAAAAGVAAAGGAGVAAAGGAGAAATAPLFAHSSIKELKAAAKVSRMRNVRKTRAKLRKNRRTRRVKN